MMVAVNLNKDRISPKEKFDKTRQKNLLKQYRDHIITNLAIDKRVNVTYCIDRVDEDINNIVSGL